MSDVKKPTEEQLKNAEIDVVKAFVDAQLTILHHRGHGELNYSKTAFTTPKGGTYLVQIVHVDGPKIDCQKDMLE